MDTILQALQSDPVVLGVTAGIFVAVAALGLAARALLTGPDPISERLRAFGVGGDTPAMLRRGQFERNVAKGLSPLARLATPTDAEELSVLRVRLARAGYRGRHASQIFLGIKMALALAAPSLFLLGNSRFEWTTSLTTPTAIWLAIAGFMGPNLMLSRIAANRQRQLQRDMPDAMDLLVTCVEAGLGLDASLSRVAAELSLSSRLLSSELRTVLGEMNAGLQRGEAFRRLAERTGLDDLRALASTLTQADVFGTSIAGALRGQAEWMRVRRLQRAEERAASVSVKMTVPLVFFILPSLIAVVMAPAAVRVAKTLLPSLGGGH